MARPHALASTALEASRWSLALLAVSFATACTDSGPACVGIDGGRCAVGDGSVDHTRQPLPTDILSMQLDPQDPVLNITRGMQPTIAFHAVGTQRDGMTRPMSGAIRFSIDTPGIGTIDPVTGVFTASGVGGVAEVRAATTDGSQLSAATSVTVNVSDTVLGPGVTDADRARFDAAPVSSDTSMAPSIDYPLANAVMPMNVYPPKVMWTAHHANAEGADLWRVRLVRPHATLDGYFTNVPDASWQIAVDNWQGIARTDVGEAIQTQVSVLSHEMRFDSAQLPFRTVDAVIAGSVYYWSPPQSRLVRLDVEPAARVDFLPHPGDTCIGCHSVSRDGRRLAGFLEGSGETLSSYDITRDLTADPAPNQFQVHYDVRRCTSWNADNTRMVSGDCGANESGHPFSIIDTNTGNTIDALTGMVGDGFDPEWSPDNSAIAFSTRGNDLAITPVMPGDTFVTPSILHHGADLPDGAVDWHPTWAPNSTWIAFQHGQTRRTGEVTGGLDGSGGQLYLIARTGGTATRLDHLLAGTQNAYRPIFSPFDSGGYFWLLFTTNRDYGNAQGGVHGQKQIWVAAIHDRPDGTSDPSEVPYYLSGQEAATALSPYWAPPPCRANGSDCATGSDCCSGECEPDQSGAPMCVPPSTTCRTRGASCGGSGDCCAGLTCTAAHICDVPMPG